MGNATRRVEQLLALATDPAASEEEARTAALQAARTIRKNGLHVSGAGSEPTYDSRPRTPQGRMLGMGRELPPYEERVPVNTLPPVIVNLDFSDDEPRPRKDYAFDPVLIQKVLRRG